MSSHPDYKRVSVLSEALGPFKRRFIWAGAYFGVIVLIVLGRQDQIQKLREYVERGQP